MTLKEFMDEVRVKLIAIASARPDDYVWTEGAVYTHFDQAVNQMYLEDLPDSIVLGTK